ncbi:MAG: hypothetical protein OXF54_02770 [Caldilineaceae bacterium]|nr:hypothetical protein [Caldilineaceae bacterium]
MNGPQVVALIYSVEHRDSIDYTNASALRFGDDPKFDLTVEDNRARFEMKEHYADVGEACEAIEPFIQQWEFEAGIRRGPNSFRLRYQEAEVIDRHPSASETGVKKIREFGHVLSNIKAEVGIQLGEPHYPSPPPAGGSVDLEDDYVVKMKIRYDQYRLGRAKLPDVAYVCIDLLEEKYEGLPAAAKECGISRNVLVKIRSLSSNKGGEDSRKAKGFGDDFTREEKRFLRAALKEVIIRAAQVAADASQNIPQITMADFPSL